jgi:hypothetical protein
MAESGSSSIEFICVDDGSEKNVYYISKDGKIRTRTRPSGFRDEILRCGDKKYYFRGKSFIQVSFFIKF